MKHDDAELIERTLEGDDHAFAALVEKYQEQIHALAWQKIGDFHIAQEITQDTFITAYQKLATLTHHNRFAGWLYVITSNKCNMWHRKKTPQQPQSLEETDPMELEEVYYSEYMSRQREEAANEKHRVLVQKLLNKLQESDRTVMTLHYIAGLTCEDISRFLGVSTNTVKVDYTVHVSD
jgi:RNA polymerase sigma factor (sigma-70 family)